MYVDEQIENETIDSLIDHFTIDYDQSSDFFNIDDIFQLALEASSTERSIQEIAFEIRDTYMATFLKQYRSSFDHERYITTYYKSILAVKSPFKRNFIEGYKLAVKGDDYHFNYILSIQYGLLQKSNISRDRLIYWSVKLCFEYIFGYATCVLQSEIKKIAQEIGVSLNNDSLLSNMSENQKTNREHVKVDVNPQITISPQFINNPTFNNNLVEKKEGPKADLNSHTEYKVKLWKRNALIALGGSSVITLSLILILLNKWFLPLTAWSSLEKYDAIKWIGIVLGVVWNGFIVKVLYDRFFDPSKEKAFRDGLKNNF